jgi:stearoyl-CoA desaturase (delta-9 desaturase)
VILIHGLTLWALYSFFTWKAFLFAFGSALLFGYSLGIFHHMLLTHRSFQCAWILEKLGPLLGTLTWRGPMAAPVRYVAMHKIHHAYADETRDPHSPHHGIWHSLLTWFWNMPHGFVRWEHYSQYTPELANDRYLAWLDHNVDLLQLIWGSVCFLGGSWLPALATGTPDWENGLRYLLYGVFVRSLLAIYLMNAVDVINHTVGYRSYETKDTSTNSFLMFVLHLGGAVSWHNNHHAHQHYFSVKRNWWEVDVHYAFLRGLRLFGLVGEIIAIDESDKPTVRLPNKWGVPRG